MQSVCTSKPQLVCFEKTRVRVHSWLNSILTSSICFYEDEATRAVSELDFSGVISYNNFTTYNHTTCNLYVCLFFFFLNVLNIPAKCFQNSSCSQLHSPITEQKWNKTFAVYCDDALISNKVYFSENWPSHCDINRDNLLKGVKNYINSKKQFFKNVCKML